MRKISQKVNKKRKRSRKRKKLRVWEDPTRRPSITAIPERGRDSRREVTQRLYLELETRVSGLNGHGNS